MQLRKLGRPALTVLLCALTAGFAHAQDDRDQPPPPQPRAKLPSPRGGLQGQKVVLPNVLGRDRSLPIERVITLPGLPGQQPNPDPRTPHYAAEPMTGLVTTGSGLRIDGRYADDNLGLQLHLGTGVVRLNDGRWYYPSRYSSRGYRVYNGRVYYTPGWYYYRPTYYSNEPVDGVLTQTVDYTLRSPVLSQPQQVVVTEVAEPTVLEKAELFMAADDLERAQRYFREHLDEDPEDVVAMRALGVALVEAGRAEDGVAMIALAYRTDPLLARTPLDLNGLGLDGRRYDSLLSRVLFFARKVDSGSAHLAGAVLLQADGKLAGAHRVLDRAEEAGLADEVLDPLRRELGVPAHGG